MAVSREGRKRIEYDCIKVCRELFGFETDGCFLQIGDDLGQLRYTIQEVLTFDQTLHSIHSFPPEYPACAVILYGKAHENSNARPDDLHR